jgi:hypothetical protein
VYDEKGGKIEKDEKRGSNMCFRPFGGGCRKLYGTETPPPIGTFPRFSSLLTPFAPIAGFNPARGPFFQVTMRKENGIYAYSVLLPATAVIYKNFDGGNRPQCV